MCFVRTRCEKIWNAFGLGSRPMVHPLGNPIGTVQFSPTSLTQIPTATHAHGVPYHSIRCSASAILTHLSSKHPITVRTWLFLVQAKHPLDDQRGTVIRRVLDSKTAWKPSANIPHPLETRTLAHRRLLSQSLHSAQRCSFLCLKDLDELQKYIDQFYQRSKVLSNDNQTVQNSFLTSVEQYSDSKVALN